MSGESSDQVRDGEMPWPKINKFDDDSLTNNSTIISSLSVPDEKPSPSQSFLCDICFKSFPAAKSLHGHMRSHPNRPYRELLPPKKSSRPIRICSDDQDRRSSKLTSEAKRGRTCNSVKGVEVEDEEELFMGAVYGLMLLSSGDDRYKTLPTRSKKDGIRVSEVNNNGGTGCSSNSVEKKREREIGEAVRYHYSSPRKVSIEDWSGLISLDSFAEDVADVVDDVAADQNPIAEDVAEDQGALVADVVAANVVAEDQAPNVRDFDLNEIPTDIYDY